MKRLYEENKDFKTFVDKVCKSYKVTVEEALLMATVREVGRYYADNKKGVSHETVNISTGGGC